jgi:hypothetical protein
MHVQLFDSLAKALGRTGTRRGVVRTLSRAVAAAILAGRQDRPVAAQFDTCRFPARECSGLCVDILSDPANCGFCGKRCSGGASCVAGSCLCDFPQRLCSGLCVNTASDPANCGTCGNRCTGGTSCVAGSCLCEPFLRECSGLCVDTLSDPANCGSCNNACRGDESCAGGTCVPATQVPSVPTQEPAQVPAVPTREPGRVAGSPPDGGPPGVSFQTLAAGSIEILAPGTASLALGSIVVAPGAVVPFDPTIPSAVLLHTVSGALTFRVEAPMMVARRGEPGKPVPSELEAVAANTEFTLRQGDSALFPPATGGEMRNDGVDEAVAWVVSIAVEAAAAGTPTP